jgi:hypothetical protein
MASLGQMNYMTGLRDKKDLTSLTDEQREFLFNEPALEALDNNGVNKVLDALKALPWLPKPGQTVPIAVPSQNPAQGGETTVMGTATSLSEKVNKGRYFIVDPIDGKEKFVKVDKPEAPSRWAGYTFLNVQASDDFYPIKDKAHREAIFEAILVDPIKAMNEYGIRLGVCGNCGRTLTDRDSRLRGLGPICAARILGAPSVDQLTALRKLGLIDHNTE